MRRRSRALAASLSLVPTAAAGQIGAADAQPGPGFMLLEHRQSAAQVLVSPVRERQSAPATLRSPRIPQGGSPTRERMLATVRGAEIRHRLPQGLLDALIATESAYRPWAVSSAGAAGLAQLMPVTAAELGVIDRFDPLQSIEGGARYLRRMLDRFGSVSLALAAYNAGPGAVARAGGIPLNGETPAYVLRVLQLWGAISGGRQ
jgi:hypothetical protein